MTDRTHDLPARLDFADRIRFDAAQLAGELDGPLVFEAFAVPWGVEVPANSWGDRIIFAPGSVYVDDPAHVPFLADHDEHGMGYATAADDRDGGLWLTMAVPRAELADARTAAVIRQHGDGVRSGVSVGVAFEDVTAEDVEKGSWAQRFTVNRARLLELSSVLVPRFANARGHLAASQPGGFTVTVTEPAPELVADPPAPPPDPRAALFAVPPGPSSPAIHPLARFASLGDFAHHRAEHAADCPEPLFAFVDQITTNNPGVIPPAWLSEIQGIITAARPTVTALGRPAPAGGMEVDWPYFDGDLAALVGEQVAQKTEVTSVRVDLKRASAPLKTWGGGSDLAWQLILRASPSYLDGYLRIMSSAYGLVTNIAAITALAAVAVDGPTWGGPAGAAGTVEQLAAALFEASVQVQTATGAPASVVLCGSTFYVAAGAAITAIGGSAASNVAGASIDAGSLDLRLAGLRLVHEPGMTAGEAIATNRAAAAWFEDGPRTLSADDVPRIGRDYAVWGMGAAGVFLATGLVKIAPAAAAGTRGARHNG